VAPRATPRKDRVARKSGFGNPPNQMSFRSPSGTDTRSRAMSGRRHASIKINDKEGRARAHAITRQSEFRCSDQVNLSPREFPDSSPFIKHRAGPTIDRNLFMRPHQCGPFAAARNRSATGGRAGGTQREREREREGEVINEESVALAKNAKDSGDRASL
jgi:hypothetical protein